MKLMKLVNNQWVFAVLTIVGICLFAPPAHAEDPPTYILQFGNSGPASSQVNQPYFVAVDTVGNVYVGDFLVGIKKYSSDGAFLETWSTTKGNSSYLLIGTTGIAIDGKGYLYASTLYGILKLTTEGLFVAAFDLPVGIDPNDIVQPWGVAVDNKGHLFAADAAHRFIQKYTDAGSFLTLLGDSTIFDFPVGLACDPSGNIYVADDGKGSVEKLTGDGEYITSWQLAANGTHQLVSPLALAWGQGAIYVCGFSYVCQKYSDSGDFLVEWGRHGVDDGAFDLMEYGMAVAGDGSIYVSDLNLKRIQKFGQHPNPVTLSSLYGGRRDDDRVVLRWQVNDIVYGDVGFRVYRDNVDITQGELRGQRRYEFVDAQAPREAVTYWLQEVDASGDTYRHGPITIPAAAALHLDLSARPNPFNPATTIAFTVPDHSPVTLAVYDATGALVRTIIDGAVMDVGSYNVPFDNVGASGVYFARLTVGKHSQTQKLVCVK